MRLCQWSNGTTCNESGLSVNVIPRTVRTADSSTFNRMRYSLQPERLVVRARIIIVPAVSSLIPRDLFLKPRGLASFSGLLQFGYTKASVQPKKSRACERGYWVATAVHVHTMDCGQYNYTVHCEPVKVFQ